MLLEGVCDTTIPNILCALRYLRTTSTGRKSKKYKEDMKDGERSSDGDGAAALTRLAVLSSRMPLVAPKAITFFRPKYLRHEQSLLHLLRSEGMFAVVKKLTPVLAANGCAGLALFNVYRCTSSQCSGGIVCAAVCGATGGLAHACVVHPIQAALTTNSSWRVDVWKLDPRKLVRGLPAAMFRDGMGFAAFFSAWHCVQEHVQVWLQPRAPGERQTRPANASLGEATDVHGPKQDPPSPSRVSELSVVLVSGGAAGVRCVSLASRHTAASLTPPPVACAHSHTHWYRRLFPLSDRRLVLSSAGCHAFAQLLRAQSSC